MERKSVMENLTKQEVLDLTEKFVQSLKIEGKEKRKMASQRAWHIVVHNILPLEKNFPNEEVNVDFIIQTLSEKGIGTEEEIKLSCHKNQTQTEESPVYSDTRTPEEKRLDEERENCAQCQLGGGGCPRHRRPR